RQHLWDVPEMAARIRRGGGEVHPEPHLRRLVDVELPLRTLLWEPGLDAPPAAVAPDVPLYRLAATPTPPPPARPLAERIEALLPAARDPLVRALEARELAALGRLYFGRNDVARAAALFEAALAVRPGDAVASVDLAVVRARAGDVAGALALVEA